MKPAVRSLAVIVPALFLISCDDMGWIDSERYKEDFHYSYNVAPGGVLSLETFNGSVEITGTSADSVEINGTKYANTQQALKDLKVDVQQTGNAVRVKTIRPYGARGGMGARFTIRVPRRFELERIVSSNASVRVEDIRGAANLRTSNGGVRVARMQGNLDAQSSNASIETNDLVGNAILRTSNGAVRAEVEKGGLEATTSNSAIEVHLVDPPDQTVRLDTSNGHIDVWMKPLRDLRASTSNSSITVHMPTDPNARLRAHTTNSSISSETELVLHGSQSKNSWDGTLGNGGPLIDLSTSNGGIRLARQ
jgi:DUF4097 and DUF4098 domain-containing protein YvlB